MVSKRRPGEPIARWGLTVLTALWVAGALIVVPFGCAVGEYEEDRDCTVPEVSVAAAIVLVLGAAVGIWRHERRIHWAGIVGAALLALMGYGNA